jgi:hypothetical protein
LFSSILYIIELNFAVVLLIIERIDNKGYTFLCLCIIIKIFMSSNSDISSLAFDLTRKKDDVIIVEELRVGLILVEYDDLKFVTRLS